MIITIDGPIATGKSTIARELAKAIGFIYFDTGAMFRALTFAILEEGISPQDKEAICGYLDKFSFDIKIKHGLRHYYVNDKEVTDDLRHEAVSKNVSEVSTIKEVRSYFVNIQRELAAGVNAVFEGRDMGTTVFPDADLKIFLTGSAEVRAKRRYEERLAKYPEEYRHLTLQDTLEEINQRDHTDSTREIAPLRKAADAIEIDTSNLSIDEIVTRIQEYKDAMKTV